MKTLLLYASAVHDSHIVNDEKVLETLRKAKENGFTRIIIVKKTQICAKERMLKTMFDVDQYNKLSISKAIKNSNACMVIRSYQAVKRKKQLIERIISEGTERNKFMFVMTT